MAKKTMLRIPPPSGDPNKPVPDNNMILKANDPTKTALDVRDHLAALVAGGNSLSPDDRKAVFQGLSNALGQEQAQRVLLHAYTFNNRPDVQRLPIEEKLRTFYDIGSNDPGVHDLLAKTKALGYGVVPGFRESSSAINQQLTGKIPPIVAQTQPEMQKKIMLKISK